MEKVDATNLVGSSYKVIEEELTIFSAQELDQNYRKWISFQMNPLEKNKLSFENLIHDFSKLIQYTFMNNGKLFVEVKGSNDQGFSFYLAKQDN